MLLELRIKNFVIIDDLIINFKKGLNILSGETGAGKSILIDALSGILGEKMTTDIIRTGFEKASLEGLFDIEKTPQVKEILDESGIDYEDDLLVLRRELFANGRGRCYANAVHIPITRLREISDYLVDIHGQNEHQNIVKIAKHRELLDSFSNTEKEVNEIRQLHSRLSEIKATLDSFQIDERDKARRIEFNSFAIKEITSADLKLDEEDELKNESMLLANGERLFTEIQRATSYMNGDDGIVQKIKKTEQSLSKVADFDTDIHNILESIRESLFSLEDVSGILRDYEENIDFSPQRINQVEERISLINNLKKKYGDTIKDILDYKDKITHENEAFSSSEEEMEKLEIEYKEIIKVAKEKALALSEKRKTGAALLEQKVTSELTDLAMGGTVFKISIKREISETGEIEADNKIYVLYPHGMDRIEFFLSANEGEDLRQLGKAASGGEMSRIMLAIKNVILSADIVESIIFDEVDAGISGKVAEIVGRKLKSLAKNSQVLVITHLPQIAAMSDSHYFVQKDSTTGRTTTSVKNLNHKEKIKEVARMLAGEKVTELSIQHSEEMITMAAKL